MKSRLVISLSISLLLIPPRQAKAQIVVADPLSEARLLMGYIKQAQAVLQAIAQTQMMVREGVMLAKHPSTNITADMAALSNILIESKGLAGTMGQMDARFRSVYAPYSANPANDYAAAYNDWATATLKTINGTLNAAGYQGGMLQNEQLWMAQVQGMTQMPLGRDESLQLSNTIATEEVAQLQSLRQLMLADMQSKAAFTAQQVNTQQAQQSASQSGFTYVTPGVDSRVW